MKKTVFRRQLRLISTLPFALLLIISLTLAAQILRQRSRALELLRTDRQLSELNNIHGLMVDMETGLRGFLLSNDLVFLEPYDRAIGAIQVVLGALLRDAPDQAQELRDLRTSLDEWLIYAGQRIAHRKTAVPAAYPIADFDGKRMMDHLRVQLQTLIDLNEAARERESQLWDQQLMVTMGLVFAGAFLAALLLGWISSRLFRRVNASFARELEDVHTQHEQYRAVFEGVRDHGLVMLDPRGHVRAWNQGAEQLTGFSALEALGHNVGHLHWRDPETRERLDNMIHQAVQVGRYEAEGWCTRRDGTRFWEEAVMNTLRTSDGHLRGFLLIFRDYTKRRQTEQERTFMLKKMEEAVRSREEFLTFASHELKTPLTVVSLRLQMMRRKSDREHPGGDITLTRSAFESLQKQTGRLAALVESMLSVARIHSGHLPFHYDRINFSQLVADVEREHGPSFRDAGCAIQKDIEPGLFIHGDRQRLEQVLMNLLMNVLKYACVDVITLTLTRHEGHARLSLRDHGPGLSADARSQVFELFQRGKDSPGHGGLGMGLFIAREIVDAHDGKIWVESEPNQGACFYIDFPLAEAETGVDVESKRASEQPADLH